MTAVQTLLAVALVVFWWAVGIASLFEHLHPVLP